MTDTFSKKKRSQIMSKIRGKWTSQEKLLRKILGKTSKRFEMHPKVFGKPDAIVYSTPPVALFLDGCFWHGCPAHYMKPETNSKYWKTKLAANRSRDKHVNKVLGKCGYKIIRIWEHDTKKNFDRLLRRKLNLK